MANSNGVFSDLFNAVGTPVQNVADAVGGGIDNALSLVQSCTNLCLTAVTASADLAGQVIQGVSDGISAAAKNFGASSSAPAAAPKAPAPAAPAARPPAPKPL